MSDPMTAALLSTMAKTPDIYIEVNRFASNHKTPELGPTGEMDQNGHRALDPQLPVVKPIRPSRRVQLRTSWDDRVNFQCVRNSQISDYGQSTIDDQGIRFDGRNPIDSMRKRFEQAHGEPSGSDGDDDEDDDLHGNSNQRSTTPTTSQPPTPA
jgi:hypothetical protein